MRIGFIGLGTMGQPMALNLIKAGYELTAYNRTPAKAGPLADAGATVASTPMEAAGDADILITIVNDGPDVEELLFGEYGAADGLKQGALVIDMSTISPAAAQEMAARLAKQKVEMMDAPVTGGDVGAKQGTLTIMVGGPESAFKKALPVLQALGKNIVHFGPAGSGQQVKVINQVICGLNILGISEGLLLAQRLGLDVDKVLAVVASGAAGSWYLDNMAPRVLRGDFSPGFSINLQQKDLRIAVETMEQAEGVLPGTQLAFDLFSEAKEKNLGHLGTHGLKLLFENKKAN